MTGKLSLLIMTLLLAACSLTKPPCAPPVSGDVVYIVAQGWHAELAMPMNELAGDMRFVSDVFPGARSVLIGYGKKTFVTAPPETFSEYLLGPVPGPAVIHMVGLRVLPQEAYPEADIITLRLSPENKRALSAAIWEDLVKDDSGHPKIEAHSHDPQGLFYAAKSGYNFFHTCNSWTADMLAHAGLPVDSGHITFSNQAMERISKAAASQCP